MDKLVSLASSYKLRIWYAQYVLNSWSLICPANSSRWHLLINMGIETTRVISPDPTVPVADGLRIGDGKNYHEFMMSVSPALVTSAWYVYVDALIPVGTVQAWETTPVGT